MFQLHHITRSFFLDPKTCQLSLAGVYNHFDHAIREAPTKRKLFASFVILYWLSLNVLFYNYLHTVLWDNKLARLWEQAQFLAVHSKLLSLKIFFTYTYFFQNIDIISHKNTHYVFSIYLTYLFSTPKSTCIIVIFMDLFNSQFSPTSPS